MTKQKSTKRALFSSALATFLCAAMLIGTTFAWFTDTASTAVNKIQSGKLDVELLAEDGVTSLEGETLQWQKAEGAEDEEILWEPGCTYKLQPIVIKNAGNLALKYKIVINGIDGDAKLSSAIEWTVGGVSLDEEKRLLPDDFDTLTIEGHMKESAGNDYQNLSIDGIGITVYATQETFEHDSDSDQYDKDAPYPVAVSTEKELLNAFENGGYVVLKNDLRVQYGVTIPDGKEVTIDLNGKTVTAKKNFVTVQSGGKLTVGGGTINAGNYVFDIDGGEVVVNGGDFTAQEPVFAMFSGSKLTVNGGTFTAKDNSVISTNGSSANGSEITVNGGVFNANIQSAGYIACGIYVANKDTVNVNGGTFNVTDGVGILMRAGITTIGKDVVINLTNTGKITAGKIGDARIDITTPSHLVVDVRSQYPGLDSTFNVINNSNYNIVEYK